MGRTCCVRLCRSQQKQKKTSFFSFPRDPKQLELWMKFVDNPELQDVGTKKVCAKHFSKVCFKDSNNPSRGLILHAVPSIIQEVSDEIQFLEQYNAEVHQSLEKGEGNIENIATQIAIGDAGQDFQVLYEIEKLRNQKIDTLLKDERKQKRSLRRLCGSQKKIIYSCRDKIKILKRQLKTKNKKEALNAKVIKAIKTNPILNESLENSVKHKNARRYKAMRLFATKQKITSSAAYKNLRSSNLICVPHPKTVTKWQENLSVAPGFNMEVFRRMKHVGREMTEQAKVVALLIDGMALKPLISFQPNADRFYGWPEHGAETAIGNNDPLKLANEAITIMARSLHTGFRQVLGYFPADSTIHCVRQGELVCEAVRLLKAAGFHTVVLIMDQHATNQKMAAALGSTEDNPYFDVDGERIVLMYDTPHLIKSLRNNLFNKNLLFEDQIISFQHIRDMADVQSKGTLCLAPRLTPKCLLPHAFDKMNVQAAATVFSRTTSIAMKTYANLGELSNDVIPTADFLNTIDGFFDCFNSKFRHDFIKPLRSAVCEESGHWDFLAGFKSKMAKAMFVPNNSFDPDSAAHDAANQLKSSQRRPPCISGIINNINALPILWKIVHEKHGFEYLCMNKVNQDPLENAFSAVRRSCGANDSPHVHQFGIAIKYFSARKTLDAIDGANCEADDTHDIIADDGMLPTKSSDHVVEDDSLILINEEFDNNLDSSELDINPLTMEFDFVAHPFQPLDMNAELPGLPQLNALTYIIGFASSKLPHRKCKTKLSLSHNSEEIQEDNYLFCRLKQYLNAARFTYPNKISLKIGLTLMLAFEQKFYVFLNESKVGVKRRLKEYVTYEDFNEVVCCVCFNKFVDCILNTLIKGQTVKMMKSFKKKTSTKRQEKRKKAKRMGITDKAATSAPTVRRQTIKKPAKRAKVLKKPDCEPSAECLPEAQDGTKDGTEKNKIEEIEKFVNVLQKLTDTFPESGSTLVETKNCKHLTIEEIKKTFNDYELELFSLFNKYKLFSDRQISKVKHLVTWQQATCLIDNDQMYEMSKFLNLKFVPEDHRSEFTEFLDSVLIFEWALRIFINIHGFPDREAALLHMKRQEQAAIENDEVPLEF